MNKNHVWLLVALGGCLIAVIALFIVMGSNMQPMDITNTQADEVIAEPEDIIKSEDKMDTLTVTINDRKFILQLANTEAAKEFAEATPFELEMKDLNQNEKYYRGESLPVAEYDVKNIHTGDLMLYEDNCIVLFYKDFETTYRYTKLGKIVDTAGLVEAVGAGNVTLIFTKQ